MNILITGANGFVGKALIEKLLKGGHHITALVRDVKKVKHHSKHIEWIEGDILNSETLTKLDKIDVAYFLIHGLNEVSDKFENLEAMAAVNFINWVRPTGAKLVYLGGLAPAGVELSPHLRSRNLIGAILGSSGLDTLEFRASIVLGDGSLSFEMIKALSERLPFRPQLEILNQPCQPISLKNLLQYLEVALSYDVSGYQIFEIAGPDVATYGELMDIYTDLAGLKRKKIKLPEVEIKVLLKGLEYTLPEYSSAGRKLAESLEFSTVMKNDEVLKVFPDIKPEPLREAMETARSTSKTYYAPLWEKDFLRVLLSDKLLTQSGLLSPDLLRNLEKVGKIKDLLTKR